MNLNDLKMKRGDLREEVRDLLNNATNQRDLDRVDELQEEIDGLDEKIEVKEQERDNERKQIRRDRNIGGSSGNSDSYGVRVYGPGEERDYVRKVRSRSNIDNSDQLRFGRLAKGLAIGDWNGAEAEKRAMATTPASSGGVMVPEPLAADVIAKALENMAVRRAGVNFVEMDSKTLTVARVDELPETEWLAENAEGSFDNPSFSPVELEAEKLSVLCDASIELIEDAPNAADVIEQAMADAIAREFDRVALMGSGSNNEPEGVMNASNVLEEAHDAALTDYTPFSKAYQAIREENEDPTALLMHPREFGTLDRLTDTTDQPLQPLSSWAEYQKYQTAQIPIDLGADPATDTVAFLADWRQLLWGIRTELQLLVGRTSETAMRKHQVQFQARLRGDIALARPKAFCKITGIEAS